MRFRLSRAFVEVPWDDVQRFQSRLMDYPNGDAVMDAIQERHETRDTVLLTEGQKVVASAALEKWLEEIGKHGLGEPLLKLRNVLLDDLHDSGTK